QDSRETRHDAQLSLDNPILDRLEPDQVHAGWTFELIAQDFADSAGRRNHRRYRCRQRRIFQPIGDLLAYKIVIAAIFELQSNEPEREHGVRADVSKARRTRDRDFERDGDITLDFLRGLAGILRDDFDNRRRGVGVSLDIEGGERRVANGD